MPAPAQSSAHTITADSDPPAESSPSLTPVLPQAIAKLPEPDQRDDGSPPVQKKIYWSPALRAWWDKTQPPSYLS